MSLISFSRDRFIPSEEVSLNVRGNYLSVTRGYQVFTFFKTANNGVPVFLEDHIDRIVGNAKSMQMNLSFSKEDIQSLVYQTLEKNDFSKTECNVMIIMAGKAPDDISGLVSSEAVDLFIVTSPIKKYPKESYQNGISLGLYEFERIDAEVKTPYTYYGGMKAHRSLVHEGSFDEVLYTSKEEILEGTTFSFFIVKDDSVITTKLDGRILGSVTRKNLLRLMNLHKINHSESKIKIDDLQAASEAFIASANRDLIPVVSIDGHMIGNGKIGPKYEELMQLYQQELLNITI
ncbi:MAG: aminotransferase class IV [Candidatus Neomarinimicrobiota bacterium]|tara:strand:+ start:337 stop:1206 length:870 start_codon:yes stop_codon:yes gene_type:complete